MPQVPRLTNTRVASTPLRQARQQPVGNALGSLAQATQAVAQVAHRARLEADRAAVTDAENQLIAQENALLFDPQNGAFTRRGKNAIGLPDQVLPEYNKRAAQIEGALASERQRAIFRESVARRRGLIERDLNRHEATERESYYDEADNARLAASVEGAAAFASDPERIAGELETQRTVLAGVAQRKGWDALKLEQERAALESKTHEAVVGRLLSLNAFDSATEYLAANAPKMKDQQVEALQRRILIEEDRLERRQLRQEKALQDAASKDGDRLLATGALTSQWIEDNRDRLSPDDYRYFYRQLAGGGDGSGPRNTLLYADLRERAGRGEDVRDEARTALQRGDIGASDYDRLLGEVESQRPGWFKRGSDYISTAAAVSDLNPDPAAAQRKAEMLDDWSDWAKANPTATEEQAQAAYKRIVQEFAIVNFDRMLLVKRSPRFLVGSRATPDLDATKAATVQALQEGRLSQDEFEEQAALIKEWEEAWRRTQTN